MAGIRVQVLVWITFFFFLPHSLVFIVDLSDKFQMLAYLWAFIVVFGLVAMSKSRKQVQIHLWLLCYNYSFPKETDVVLPESWDVIRHSLKRNTWKVYIQLCLMEEYVFMKLFLSCGTRCFAWPVLLLCKFYQLLMCCNRSGAWCYSFLLELWEVRAAFRERLFFVSLVW